MSGLFSGGKYVLVRIERLERLENGTLWRLFESGWRTSYRVGLKNIMRLLKRVRRLCRRRAATVALNSLILVRIKVYRHWSSKTSKAFLSRQKDVPLAQPIQDFHAVFEGPDEAAPLVCEPAGDSQVPLSDCVRPTLGNIKTCLIAVRLAERGTGLL